VTFRLGTLSTSRLLEVQVDLARAVRKAIEMTEQDFQVFEGLRTIDRQRELVAAGASRTLDSYHLADKYGQSHAVDLVPFIAGRVQWQDGPCLTVAKAMHRAARQFMVPITWGAVWDIPLAQLNVDDLEGEIDSYVARHVKDHGRKPLVDRPHYQVPRT
jgi:peptidoglycan L-alanyl-D-glutamate endopeptidase CwlK